MKRYHGMIVALAVAALPVGAAAQAVEATDDNDRAVHAFLSAVDLGEVQMSTLATQRATNAEVRSFAQSMIADHGNALHTREMLMQTENSGLLQRMAHTDTDRGNMPHSNPAATGIAGTASSVDAAAQGAGPGTAAAPPAQGRPAVGQAEHGHSNPAAQGVAGQTTASGGSAHAEHANAQGGSGSGTMQGGSATAQGGSGSGNMQGGASMGALIPGLTPDMMLELEAQLREFPMSRPVMEGNARNLQVLQGVTGPQFDKSYLDAQIGAHRYALQNIDRMLAQTGALGDDIRGTLQQTRTAVASHLQMAEQIRGRLQ